MLDEFRIALSEKGFDNIELLLVELMGIISPMPSATYEMVYTLEKEEKGKGLDYLFNLQIKNNYIQKTAIDRNIYFKKSFGNKFLEITINLSKPEKNNNDIKKLLIKNNDVKYPKCLLCIENLGYKGRVDHPARENIRIVPMKLNGEEWFLQYSPYAYFDHHAIIINKKHDNMVINHATFKKLLEFVNLYPTFFVGSNSDLPIVGGSILNHEHYQGGLHLLPMFYSEDKVVYLQNENIKISSLDWYNSVIKFEGKDIGVILKFANKVFDTWINYDDLSIDILSHSGLERHSTVTPIARKKGDVYELFFILRNNRTNDEHKDGIFHAHKEYHNIKSEGIGLIEAMGLFILPPRLKRQLEYVRNILTGELDVSECYLKYEDMIIHKDMISELIKKHSTNLSTTQANYVIRDTLSEVCKNILINTACFKQDEKGLNALEKFVKKALDN